MNSEITFISNNVKGIQNSVKRIKSFEYLKSYVTGNGFIFLQEMHSCINDEIMWTDEFNGELFFSHGKTNSCGVAIGFYGSKTIEQINKISDKSGRILLVEATVDDTVLFILVLEIAFIFIKENKNIKGINIFDNIFLYSAYADDTTFFLSDEDSVIEVINAFHTFSLVSGLKPNEAKCETAGIGVLKGVSLPLCGMDCIDLTKKTIKVLGIHSCYNKKLETEENFIRHVYKNKASLGPIKRFYFQ